MKDKGILLSGLLFEALQCLKVLGLKHNPDKTQLWRIKIFVDKFLERSTICRLKHCHLIQEDEMLTPVFFGKSWFFHVPTSTCSPYRVHLYWKGGWEGGFQSLLHICLDPTGLLAASVHQLTKQTITGFCGSTNLLLHFPKRNIWNWNWN